MPTDTNVILQEAVPAMVDPPKRLPHPDYNPCSGCPRWTGMAVLTVGQSTLMRDTNKLFWKGLDVNITVAEYRVVGALILNHGKPLSYRKLYDLLTNRPGFLAGQGEDGPNSNMRSAIKRIRRKLLRLDPTFDAIRNLQGFGYAWKED
jgi:DNA-binding response OmpR family regulator